MVVGSAQIGIGVDSGMAERIADLVEAEIEVDFGMVVEAVDSGALDSGLGFVLAMVETSEGEVDSACLDVELRVALE